MGNGAPKTQAQGGRRTGAVARDLPGADLTPVLDWLCTDTGADAAVVVHGTDKASRLLGTTRTPIPLEPLLAGLTGDGTVQHRHVTTTAELGCPGPTRALRAMPLPGDKQLLLCLVGAAGTGATPPANPGPAPLGAVRNQAQALLRERDEARLQTGQAARAELLQETLDGLEEPLCTCDRQGRILVANEALKQLLGHDRGDLVGNALQRYLGGNATAFMEHLKHSADPDPLSWSDTWLLHDSKGQPVEVSVRRTRLRRDHGPDRILLRWTPVMQEHGNNFLRDARATILERVARREPVTATLEAICELAEGHFPETIAAISIPRPDGDRLLVAPDMPAHFRRALEEHHRFDPDESLCASTVHTGEHQICADVRTEERWPDYGWFAVAHGIHAIWSEPLRGRDGATLGALTVFRYTAGPPSTRDIEALKHLAGLGAVAVTHARFLEELEAQAFHDGLTGLPNRRLLSDRLTHQIAMAQRTRRPFAVFLLDVDGFKAVNDDFGHEEGDAFLCRLAERLAGVLRPGDTLARLGGDEFVVVAPLGQPGDAPAVADKLIAATETVDCPCAVGLSIGISLFPDHGESERPLLHRADRAMYQAKQQGKNRWAVYGTSADLPASQPTNE